MVYEGPSNWTILKHPNYLFFPEFREIFLWSKPAKTTLYLPQGWRQPVLISAFCLSASCFNVWWSFQLSAVVGSLHKRAIAEAILTTRRQMNAELFNHHPHVLQSVQRQDKSFHRWLLDDFCSCWMTLQDWYLLLSPTHTVCWWQAGRQRERRQTGTLEATGGVRDNSYLQAPTRTFATERIKLVQL